MKFCKITRENVVYFKDFLPRNKFEETESDPKSLSLGMFEDSAPIGAVILYDNADTLEIRSLLYDEGVEDGLCESEVLNFINRQNWDHFCIEYTVSGTEEYLGEKDYIMMDLGFFPMKGNVKKYQATLGEIARHQGSTLEKIRGMKDIRNMKIGKEMTNYQIDTYNRSFPKNRYFRSTENEELSCFLFRQQTPVAGIIASDNKKGSLIFEWMSGNGVPTQDMMKLILFCASNALSKYPDDTNVIICPFLTEVEGLISKFGFAESPEKIESRIYTYYIPENNI